MPALAEIKNLERFQSEHHAGKKFRNIWGSHPDTEKEKFDPNSGDVRHKIADVAGWIWRKGVSNKVHGEPASVKPLGRENLEPIKGKTRVFWLGHASCLIQSDGLNILTDPVYADRVSPVSFAGPKRLCARAIETPDLPHIDAIVLSHNHYDHAEATTLKFLATRDKPPVFVPLRVAPLMRQFGFTAVYEMDWWQRANLDRFTITCLPAKHFSGRSATDRNETLWASFMISVHGANKHFYFAGDTAYSPHFSEIAEEFPAIDCTFMPIGAYLPRWFMREVHVSPAEAIQAFIDLSARTMLGIHWGTYDLADEDWDEPRREAIEASAKAGIAPERIKITAVGEWFEV